jgi:hypothetical protein
LNHIRPLIEPRASLGFGGDQPEVLPQSADRQLQAIEGGAKDVLDDDEAAVGGQDHPIRREPGVRNAAALPVQFRHRRCQLSNEPRGEGRMHTRPRIRALEDLGHALAGGEYRDQRQVAGIQTLDRANSRERRVVEGVELVNALPKGILEAGGRREQRMETEQFEGRRPAVVEHPQPISDAVANALGIPARQGRWRVKAAPSVDDGVMARCHRFANRRATRIDPSHGERVANRGVVHSIVHKKAR